MNFKKNLVALGVFIFLGILVTLPATRDEADWCWAQFSDKADDYLRYFHKWPKSRHVTDARLLYQLRERKEATRAMISAALKDNSAAQGDPQARQERLQRVEHFLWRQVSKDDSIMGYRVYLQRYPDGEFAVTARRRIQDLYAHGAVDPVANATNR